MYWYGHSKHNENTTIKSIDWKTETPTQEGWYWVVMDYQDPDIKVQVKHLAAGDPPRWLSNVTHWLGPIPPPEMPE